MYMHTAIQQKFTVKKGLQIAKTASIKHEIQEFFLIKYIIVYTQHEYFLL